MSTFLMILLAVVLVVGGLAFFVFFWLRTKFRKVVGNYNKIAPFLVVQTARLNLRIRKLPSREDVDQERAAQLTAMGRLWSELSAKGFKRLGTLHADDERLLIAGQHPANHLLALVTCLEGMPPFVEFIALSPTNTAMVVSGDPAACALQLPSLTVIPMRTPTITPVVRTMGAMLPGRAVDLRMLILLVERLHAARMDSRLARPPTPAEMSANAALRLVTTALDEADQQRALDMNRSAWLAAVRIALLDNGRRKLKLDEEAWGRLEGEVIAIHQGMDADEVIATLSGHALVDKLGAQLKLQKFGPAQLFDEINRRLGDDHRRLVANLGIPVQARLFARADALQAAGIESQGESAGTLREYLYEAHDRNGQLVQDSVAAMDVADAKLQLARMGCRDVKVRTSDLIASRRTDTWDAASAARRINAGYDTLGRAVLKIFWARKLAWLPGLLVLSRAMATGREPYLGLALLVAGLLYTAHKALPSVLYNQLLWARVHGHYGLGLRYVSLLGHMAGKGRLSPMLLAAERAKMLAGLGRLDEALDEFSLYAGSADQVAYLIQAGAIHDAAGRRDNMIATQRQLLDASGNSQETRIDLAWSLMRYTTSHDEARALVAGIHPSGCAELYGTGLRIVHALLDQAAGRHRQAIAALRKEHDALAGFGSPLMAGIRAELCAFIALSMKAEGQRKEADALWKTVLPLMRVHHHHLLIARYDKLA
jgi:hypothetical protein